MLPLTFKKPPQVQLGSNIYVKCPVVLQFNDTPLIELSGYKTQQIRLKTHLYDQRGNYLGHLLGGDLVKTKQGEQRDLELKNTEDKISCSLDGQVLVEIIQDKKPWLRITAELYTPCGHYLQYLDSTPTLRSPEGKTFVFNDQFMNGNMFGSCGIGVWVQSDGSLGIACG
ncbi:MAG: hypothetical protein P8J55_05810 [Pseudomonadales bacterium]|nr:hypothetical protein [Pseudomonadales bacterium]